MNFKTEFHQEATEMVVYLFNSAMAESGGDPEKAAARLALECTKYLMFIEHIDRLKEFQKWISETTNMIK